MWGRRYRGSNAHACSNVRTVDRVSDSEAEGDVGTLFQDPIHDQAFVGFCDNVGIADFGERLTVGVGADAAVPINVRIDLRVSGAAGNGCEQNHATCEQCESSGIHREPHKTRLTSNGRFVEELARRAHRELTKARDYGGQVTWLVN